MAELRQFKLTNGDELLCEVLEWDDDVANSIVIRHAFKLICIENEQLGLRYYTFRSWMTYTEEPDKQILLNAAAIIGEAIPSDKLVEQYQQMVDGSYKLQEDSPKEVIDTQKHRDDLYNAAVDMMRKINEEFDADELPIPGTTIH